LLQLVITFAVAIASGVTTMIGGGTGPAAGSNATTCTPGWFLEAKKLFFSLTIVIHKGAHYMKMMLQATDELPLNFGFTGKVIELAISTKVNTLKIGKLLKARRT